MSLLCTLKNISLSFGPKIIFKDAQISISSNERIGLLGLNGKGKSTLFKILTEEIKPDHSTPPFEFTKARGEDVSSKKFSLFYVPQELPFSNSLDYSIKDYFFIFYPALKKSYSESLDLFKEQGGWELLLSFESYLKYFGLNDFEKKINFLSGGEQKKILLSLGLSSNANIILWDEPTNHLDIDSIKLFEDELSSVEKTYLLISHDRVLLSKLTNKIFHITNGKIESFNGSYTDYLQFLQNQEEAKTKLLSRLQNNLEREQAWMRQGVKARGTRSKKRVENFLDLRNKVEVIKANAKKSLDLNIVKSNRQTKVLISFDHLSFQYSGANKLFSKITGEINKGNKIGLLGKNGVGKTTLLKLFLQELIPTHGHIKIADNLKVQYFSQKRDELETDISPYKILGDGSDFVIMPDGSKKHVVSYFESFLFHRDDINRPMKTFSGGEKSRLQLALNLTKSGDILIFDEPTNDLDLETIQILEDTLSKFEGAAIIISHDRAFLSTVTDKIWLIEDEKLLTFEGGYEQVGPYLDAIALEKEYKTIESDLKNPTADISKKNDERLTNKDKIRLENIYPEIEKTESKLKLIEEKITNLDYTKLSGPNNGELKILLDAQKILEEKLLELYQELEILEKKLPD